VQLVNKWQRGAKGQVPLGNKVSTSPVVQAATIQGSHLQESVYFPADVEILLTFVVQIFLELLGSQRHV
jgi:hypothetical protein